MTMPLRGSLHHGVPSWVKPDAIFHIRIRCLPETPKPLTDEQLALPLLESVRHYVTIRNWYCHLFLLMPDHLHALIFFPRDKRMSRVVGDWKKYHYRVHGVLWQDNYFDHRIRNEAELRKTEEYIRRNPVAKGLCNKSEDWPWVTDAHSVQR